MTPKISSSLRGRPGPGVHHEESVWIGRWRHGIPVVRRQEVVILAFGGLLDDVGRVVVKGGCVGVGSVVPPLGDWVRVPEGVRGPGGALEAPRVPPSRQHVWVVPLVGSRRSLLEQQVAHASRN